MPVHDLKELIIKLLLFEMCIYLVDIMSRKVLVSYVRLHFLSEIYII